MLTGTGTSLLLLDDLPDATAVPERVARSTDVGAVIHTSGTTGRPQPVFLRQAEMAARTRVYESAIELRRGDRYCSASPFYHVAGMGMTFVALCAGVTVIPFPAFSVDAWRELATLEPTHALLVPTMIDVLLQERALDIGLRVLQYGAAPIHPDTLREAMVAAPATRLIQIFGQTEVSPITQLTHVDHGRAAAGESRILESVGRSCLEVELRVETPDADGVGELLVRAPHVFAASADGWRHTGDLGTIDDEGFVFLRGRRGDRIVRGGENISPTEIETVIALHPEVADVCVVGVPDRRWGETVKAVVVARDPGAEPGSDEIQESGAQPPRSLQGPDHGGVRRRVAAHADGQGQAAPPALNTLRRSSEVTTVEMSERDLSIRSWAKSAGTPATPSRTSTTW